MFIKWDHMKCWDPHCSTIILFDTGNQEIRRNEESNSYKHGTYRNTENISVLPPSQQSSPLPFYHHQHPPIQQSVFPNHRSSHYTQQYAYSSHHSTYERMQYPPQLPQSYFSAPLSRNDCVTTNEFCLPYHHNHTQQQQQQQRYSTDKISSERLNRADGLSDCNIPGNSPIIWELSQEVKEWKFLARNLDLEERVIEEIDQYTKPNKMRDKSLRVFTEWINSASKPSWKALGEALLEAEYVFLYEKLLEIVKRNAV